MRLTHKEIALLKEELKSLSEEAQLYLFGSRVDDAKRGGDIDLLVVSGKLDRKDLRRLRLAFHAEFGEQKMDILLDDGTFKNPFHRMIREKAVLL